MEYTGGGGLGDVYTTSLRGDGGCFVGLVKEPLEGSWKQETRIQEAGFLP